MKLPDIDAVRAFVLVSQLKSFTKTADTMGTSQAAVSLKIKRLEEAVGRPLLERTPRRVTLSMEGLAFQASAQRRAWQSLGRRRGQAASGRLRSADQSHGSRLLAPHQ